MAKRLTEAELLINTALRELHLRYEREVRFALPRQWRFDWILKDYPLAIELEGGSWIGGRHSRGDGFEKDCEKYAEAAIRCWFVMRVTPKMAKDGRAKEFIRRWTVANDELHRRNLLDAGNEHPNG